MTSDAVDDAARTRFNPFPKGAISPSQLAEIHRCPKAHKLARRDHIRRKGKSDDNLLFGRAGHRVMETMGRLVLEGEPTSKDAWEDAVQLHRAELVTKLEKPELAMTYTLMFSEYQRAFGSENAGYNGYGDVEAVEQVLEAPQEFLERHGGFGCIADAVLRNEYAQPVLVEHKFNGKKFYGDPELIVKKLLLDDQVNGLAYCGRERYGEIPLILYNVFVKTKTPSFQRIWLRVTEEGLRSWEQDTISSCDQMLDRDCANRASCYPKSGGFVCDYVDWCHGSKYDQERLYEVRLRKGDD